MDNDNLIDFKSPIPQRPMKSLALLYSPNSQQVENLKTTVDATSFSEHVNRRSSFCIGDFPASRQSLSFQNLDSSDFGRESLGILPPDFNTTRDSLCFMNISSCEVGRESLGILNINSLRDSLIFSRESIDLLNLTDFKRESDCGRESLGILHLKSPDVKFAGEDKNNVPEIMLTLNESNDIFDTAFLETYRKLSACSSVSSYNPSFASSSLDGPSRIYSVKSVANVDKTDILNDAIANIIDSKYSWSSSSNNSSLNIAKIISPRDIRSFRSRIQSLPVTWEEDLDPLTHKVDFNNEVDKRYWSTDRISKNKTDTRNCNAHLDFKDDANNDFRDSVFIEGHHIADRIADGSILDDSFDGETGVLDCTPQPIWPCDLSDDENKEKEKLKSDRETVFKTVDKMLPPSSNIKIKIKTSRTDSNSSGDSDCKINKSSVSDKNISKLIQNLSDIGHDASNTSKYSAKGKSQSKDAKELLENLSEILNSTNRSELQKSEGYNLICNLAEILNQSNGHVNPNSLDDSGHSSFIELPDKEEEKDLQSKNSGGHNPADASSNRSDAAMDISLKSKHINSLKGGRLSHSFSASNTRKTASMSVVKKRNSSASGVDSIEHKSTISNNSSANTTGSRTSGNASRLLVAGRVKAKNVTGGKKGPMKAVIPVGDMKKRNVSVTPEKTTQKSSFSLQSTRTSTPINEPKLKPVAASTPTGRRSTKDSSAISPLARPNKAISSYNFGKGKLNNSVSALPKTITKEFKFVRRNSVSEIKNTETEAKIKRSNSLGKETGIMSSLERVRQNIVKSPYYQLKKQTPLTENNNLIVPTQNKEKSEGNKRLLSVTQPANLSKLRKSGKENFGK